MKPSRLVVAGAGPVGLALAIASAGFEVEVFEAAPAGAGPPDDYDLRIFALSPGSRTLLRELGAWDAMAPERIAAVRRMEIFGDAGAVLSFEAAGSEALAWIVEAGRMAAALEAAAASRPSIRVRRATPAVAFGASASGAWAALEGGERVEGDLLVGADGPDSRVRAALGIEADEKPYREIALVANFETERAHEGIARQWFRTDGVLAWLPLPGQRISIVWSAPEALARELAALEPPAFASRVALAGGAALGELRPISRVGQFPLRLIRVAEPLAAGAVLVGDAAHAVHPLAGQGVNLGFQDARVLADVLAHRSPLERPGDLAVLRRYARARREEVGAMQLVTHGLDRLFASRVPGFGWLRNAGLRLVNTQGWAKRGLANRAMR